MNKFLISTAVALALTTGVYAQAQAPATGSTTPAQTTLAPTQVTIKNIMGAAIYAPKAGTPTAAAPTTGPTGDPVTTGSTPGGATQGGRAVPTVSDANWNAMRENHDNIGDVSNIVVTPDGRIQQVVLGVGGFLGLGEKSVAVNWGEVSWMQDSKGKLFGIVHMTKQQLEAAPRFVDRT
jgi:PRC-barrel domain